MVEGRRIAHLSFTDYYALLGVMPETETSEIRRVIRAKILEHHPDRNPNDPHAADRLREVIQAKEILTEPSKRKIYDGVYFAKALVRWTGYPRAETHRVDGRPDLSEPRRDTGPFGPGSYRSTSKPRGSRYEEILSQARNRSKNASEEKIDHLVEEIEGLFRSQGLKVEGLKQSEMGPQTFSQFIWGTRGAVFFGLAFLIFGLMKGTVVGAIIMSILGFTIGWFMGSNAGGLVAMLFLCLRLLVAGVFVGAIAISFASANSGLKQVIPALIGMLLLAVAGAVVTGLYRVGIGSLRGRRYRSLRYEVVHYATWGAWIAALAGLSIIYVGPLRSAADSASLAWFTLFSFYILLDHYLFSQPTAHLY
jgi:hypothetical protein